MGVKSLEVVAEMMPVQAFREADLLGCVSALLA